MTNIATSSIYDISNIDDLPEEVKASLKPMQRKSHAMTIFNGLQPGEAITIDNYIVAYYRTFKQPVDRVAAMNHLSYYIKIKKIIKKDNLYSLPVVETKQELPIEEVSPNVNNKIEENEVKPAKVIKRK